MNKLFSLPTALCLPAPEIEALIQGQTIAAMPKIFIRPGQRFALYPAQSLSIALPFEKYYRVNILPVSNLDATHTSNIKSWAKCEFCQILDETKPLDILSQLTIFSPEALKEIIKQQQHIFLAYLRVYNLASYQEFAVNSNIQDKLGKFVSSQSSITVTEELPVLSDRTFTQRKQQLEKLEPPLHPELQELQSALASIAITNPAAKNLDDEIKVFLGWNIYQSHQILDTDLTWIKKIAEVGNSSDGHQFEKLVRRGLIKLGFTGLGLNPDATGGAGGMDFYTENPFSMVGECKATKTEKVPDGTPAQLLKIGMNHLGKFQYDNSIKLIVAAGELNSYALRTATENHMNVISPETLQKLVELQTYYKNSINLLELKLCLQQAPFGLAEEKVNNYLEKVEQSIKLRSHLVNLVKNYLHNSGTESAGVDALHGAYFGSNPPRPIKTEEMHEILIELSSPLTGYLGREKGTDWRSDRFYFLRELQIYSR
ncbi:DUF1802 family protein [Nostoc sp. FACHB-87]|uniref:DUF1802 family protein n=1 Tax=Nostocaceae TaxID=1162 RepID=UPI00168459EF|nr:MULTISPECIES: DUF1802 family protein [Nostocaceae]MBD2457567.1 DUF1802 family protein [Nostoc sp. FACHB-87]MBD2478723.1 DUF1802 family protein [Anabaena sp. FACHB-83]